MSRISYQIDSSFKAGFAGEDIFYDLFKDRLELKRLSGRGSDFLIRGMYGLEVKSDRYDMSATKNFFFERYYETNRKANGGPWQALEKGSKYFAYFFLWNRETKSSYIHFFETKVLVEGLEPIVKTLTLTPVGNFKGGYEYQTYGYKVPRSKVQHLVMKHYPIGGWIDDSAFDRSVVEEVLRRADKHAG